MIPEEQMHTIIIKTALAGDPVKALQALTMAQAAVIATNYPPLQHVLLAGEVSSNVHKALAMIEAKAARQQ